MAIRIVFIFSLILLLAAISLAPASAAPAPAAPFQATPPPSAPSQPAAPTSTTGFPWLAVLVFGAAFALYTFIKSRLPANTITTTTCVPLIDPAKMEAERKRIAEEEAGS